MVHLMLNANGQQAVRLDQARLAVTVQRLDLDRVSVCPGAQSALLAVIGTLAAPGEVICAEALTYPGLKALAAQLRVTIIGLAMDAEGILPEAFEAACRDHPVTNTLSSPDPAFESTS